MLFFAFAGRLNVVARGDQLCIHLSVGNAGRTLNDLKTLGTFEWVIHDGVIP